MYGCPQPVSQVYWMDICFAYEDVMKRKEKEGANRISNNGNEVRFYKIKCNVLDLERI